MGFEKDLFSKCHNWWQWWDLTDSIVKDSNWWQWVGFDRFDCKSVTIGSSGGLVGFVRFDFQSVSIGEIFHFAGLFVAELHAYILYKRKFQKIKK